ncbi:KilA-N domain-containing protein [Suttonella ornithocola]|uniref:KilA-N domain n=3 Tax=Suttonella ornithocola TaxID=279832 RepID=A0A380MTH5_9GAMM|nr:KilA-N domain-containing protein [Suttonella ornithocola]SUO95223.1 KilA-N domain [Suttonella ornithocola]
MSKHTQVASANLSILDTDIRCIDGLYSLNDLHKAAGGEEKHKPNRFLRNEQTQALIAEIDNEINKSPNLGFSIKTVRGVNGGTYACKEIVVAYGAWISAFVHLAVIRTFLATVEQSPYITDEQLVHIKQGVREMVYRTGKYWQAVYNELFNYVQAPSVREIRRERYPDACRFLNISEQTRGLKERDLEPVDALPPPHIVMVPIDTRFNGSIEVVIKDGLVGCYHRELIPVNGIRDKPYGTLLKARFEAGK